MLNLFLGKIKTQICIFNLYSNLRWCRSMKTTIIQRNLYNGASEVLLKTYKFHHLLGTVYFLPPLGSLNNPIFSNLGLCAACWACFMCHHKLWPTSVSHPFSSLYSSFGFAGGKHCQKITIPIFRLVLQNFSIQVYFPYIIFYRYLLSLLSSGWFVIAVCGSISVREVVKH